jgi:hypothetical protein
MPPITYKRFYLIKSSNPKKSPGAFLSLAEDFNDGIYALKI